jgi:hypothetical protein
MLLDNPGRALEFLVQPGEETGSAEVDAVTYENL